MLLYPLELVKGPGVKLFPLHAFLRAYLWPRAPGSAIRPGKSAFRIRKKVPEVLSRAKSAYTMVSINIPHKLTKEIAERHFAKSEGRKPVPKIHFNCLAKYLLVAEIITSYYLSTIVEDLPSNLDVLMVKGKAFGCHGLSWLGFDPILSQFCPFV